MKYSNASEVIRILRTITDEVTPSSSWHGILWKWFKKLPFLFLAIVAFLIAVFLAGAIKIYLFFGGAYPMPPWIFQVPLLLALSALVFSTLSLITQGLQNALYLFNARNNFLESFEEGLDHEAGVLHSLLQKDQQVLSFVTERIDLERSQMEERMGFMVGVVGKVGVIPTFAAWFVAYSNLDDSARDLFDWDFVAYSAIGLYLSFLYVHQFVQQLEHFHLLVRFASKHKEN